MSFDTQLKDRLGSAASAMPGEPLDIMMTLSAARRSRRMHMIAAVAAAAVLVAGGVIAAATIGGDATQNRPVIAPEPQVSDATAERAFATVGEFFGAINTSGERNQAAAMWALFSPDSKAYFDNDVKKFDPVSFNGETMGAWEFAKDSQMFLTVVTTSDQEVAGVVTVSGTVSREGITEWDAISLPVRIVGGQTTIELFSDAPYPAAATPAIGASEPQTLPPGSGFSAVVSKEGVGGMTVSVSGVGTDLSIQGDAQPNLGIATGNKLGWSWTPAASLVPGRYVVTFVVTSETGGLSATAEPFVVE